MIISLIIAILLLVHTFFFLGVVRKNFALIDIAWGLGPVVVGFISYLYHPLSLKNALLLLVVTLWGVRLALYLFKRSRGKGEDPRYTKYRKLWAPHENLNAYFKIFLLQGVLMLVVSLPVSVGISLESQKITFINWFGLLLWFLGFSLEVWSDHYLARWKALPANQGKICTSGPWSLCRFPNYFGEVLLWYGIYFLAFELKSSWSILGAFTIHYFIMKVTGIPPLEEKYKKREDYLEYSQKVPRFVPFTKP